MLGDNGRGYFLIGFEEWLGIEFIEIERQVILGIKFISRNNVEECKIDKGKFKQFNLVFVLVQRRRGVGIKCGEVVKSFECRIDEDFGLELIGNGEIC